MKIRDLNGAALDAAIADLLGVDRLVPWDCALAIVTHLRTVRVERPNQVLRVPKDGGEVEVSVFVPHETDQEPFEGMELASQILYGEGNAWRAVPDYYAGRALAKVWKGIEREADAYLLPAPPYSTSWDAVMQIRAWVAGGSLLRRSAFSLQVMLQVATHDSELYQLMQSQASADPSMQLFVVTQAGLSVTPVDLCRAALVTAAEERRATAKPPKAGGVKRPPGRSPSRGPTSSRTR